MLAGRVVVVSEYHVIAQRWALGWELHIEGVGVTQARSLATAERMAREYITLTYDLDDDADTTIHITPELDPTLAAETQAAREAASRAEQARDDAARRAREVVHDLKSAGLSSSDVAVVLGVSTQRVSQLAAS